MVFDWTGADRFYEWQVPGGAARLQRVFLTCRCAARRARGIRTPSPPPATSRSRVTLRDGAGETSRINIGAYGGGLEEPYARASGWHNEMETIRIRLTDFLDRRKRPFDLWNMSRHAEWNIGPSWGAASGRIMIDDMMLTERGLLPGPPRMPVLRSV